MKTNKQNSIIYFSLWLIAIILINIIGKNFFFRIDLTSDKRFTLTNTTKRMLENLDDVIYFKIYLEGDFPAGFKRLQQSTKEILDEFRRHSNNLIEYEFIDPLSLGEGNEKNDIYNQLISKGLEPTSLNIKSDNGNKQQIIFPCALVVQGTKEISVQLLKNQIGTPPEMVLNNSIQLLEYEFSNAINQLTIKIPPVIGFLEGHGELSDLELADIGKNLSKYYEVRRVRINGKLKALKNIDLLIIPKPDTIFPEKDKFIIDQFIMNGGKTLWFIDHVNPNMDSLQSSPFTFALPLDLNLDDLFFKYGARINPDLLMDMQSAGIPINTSLPGSQPNFQMFPWPYFPLIVPHNNNPISKNINAIKCEFASSLDTIKLKNIKKSILLQTSQYTRTLNTPTRISLNQVNFKQNNNLYTKKNLPIALLLEGNFNSLYKNRIPSIITESDSLNLKWQSLNNKMIIVSDGDLIRNQIHVSSGKAYPLGYDKYTKETYGNLGFIINSVNYLLDNVGLLEIRNREVKLRLLDNTKVSTEKRLWQSINIFTPILFIIIIAFTFSIIRKRKYKKQK